MPYEQLFSLDTPNSPMPLNGNMVGRYVGQTLSSRSVRSHLTGTGGDLVMGNILEDTDQLADAFQQGNWLRLLKEAYAWSRVLRIPIWLTLKLGMIPLLPASLQQKMWKRKDKLLGQAYGDVKRIALPNQQYIDRYLDKQATRYSLCYREAIPSQRNFLYGMSAMGHGFIYRLQRLEPVKSTTLLPPPLGRVCCRDSPAATLRDRSATQSNASSFCGHFTPRSIGAPHKSPRRSSERQKSFGDSAGPVPGRTGDGLPGVRQWHNLPAGAAKSSSNRL